MEKINDFTNIEILGINSAISSVRDQKMQNGSSVPGCAFPAKESFAIGKIEGQISSTIKNYEARVQELRKKLGWEDADHVVTAKEVKIFNKETKELGEEVQSDLSLQPMALKAFLDMEKDEYFRRGKPVPQEFFSGMGRLIVDDTEEEKTEEAPMKKEKK